MLSSYDPPVHHLDALIHEWGDEYGDYLNKFYDSNRSEDEEPMDFETFLDDVTRVFDYEDEEVM